MIGQMFGNYRIDKLLGEGSIGTVYLATDLNTNRQFALKFITPRLAADAQFQQAFMEEMQLASSLDHANITRIIDYNAVPRQAYVVMEYFSGGSLRRYLRHLSQQGRLMPSVEVNRFGRQLASALAYAHRTGMIHRAVNPDNIMLRTTAGHAGSEMQVVLSDFGLSRLKDQMAQVQSRPINVDFTYLSPEQCTGNRVDARSDVYALGTVLYEMVSGRPPFSPRSVQEALQMHTRQPVTPLSQVRPGVAAPLEQLIMRSLAKNPLERFQSAGEMSQQLTAPGRIESNANPTSPENGASRRQIMHTQFVSQPPIPTQMPQYDSLPAAETDIGHTRIVFFKDGEAPETTWLTSAVTRIGREGDNDIVLDSGLISRYHARIDRGYDGYFRVMDLGSTNGVWLGAKPLMPNTPQAWKPGETLRIGEYWFKLETVTRPNNQPQQQQPGVPAALRSSGPGVAPPPPLMPARNVPETTTNRFSVRLVEDIATVAAGARTILTVEVANQGESVDHFIPEVRGLPAGWFSLPEPLNLLPGQRSNMMITFNPPRNSQSTSGAHTFDVVVKSRQSPNEYVSTPANLQIDPFYNFSTDLHPQRLRNSGSTELSITNTGNAADNFSITAQDQDEALHLEPDVSNISIAPGQTERVFVRAKPQRRHVLGRSKEHRFSIHVKSSQPDGIQQQQSAEFVSVPFIPPWTMGVASLAMVLLFGAGLFSVFNAFANSAGQQVLDQGATEIAAAAEVTDEFDTDGDGLTDAEERALGTDKNLIDTDKDGLSDYDEVNKYQTNPLNQDSDADNLLDGEEINQGTNPNAADTDQDAIPDGIDAAPLLTSTAIPSATLTPTWTPTATATPTPTPTATPFPKIQVSPGSLDYTLDNIEDPGIEQSVTIVNTGNKQLSISALTLESEDFRITTPSSIPLIVPVGSSQVVTILFDPKTDGEKKATMEIVSDDAELSSVSVTLTGRVGPTASEMSVNPSALDFPVDATGTLPSVQQVTISNNGNVPLIISTLTLESEDYKINNAPAIPLEIATGSSHTLNIAFNPTSAGEKTATLTIVGNDPATMTATVSLSGRAQPALRIQREQSGGGFVDVTSVNFGSLTIGLENQIRMRLFNDGPVGLEVATIASAITCAGGACPPEPQFVPAPDPATLDGQTIQPGAGAEILVTFSPTGTAGLRSLTWTIASNDPISPRIISFSAEALAPQITVNNAVSFGPAPVGAVPTQDLIITNTGTGQLTLGSLSIADGTFFQITQVRLVSNGSDTIVGTNNIGPLAPLSENPGNRIVVTLQFTPAGPSSSQSTIMTITSNDPATPSQDITISGQVQAANIVAATDPIAFSNQRVGTASSASNFLIQNTGDASMTVTLQIVGSNPGSFSFNSLPGVDDLTLNPAIAPGTSRTVSVYFIPQSIGAKLAQITITTNDPDTTVGPINLTGMGIGPDIRVTPTSADFGCYTIGLPIPSRAVTIFNDGTDTLTVTGYFEADIGTANGAVNDRFYYDLSTASGSTIAPSFPIIIAPNGNSTLYIRFNPNQGGLTYSVQFTFTSDASGDPDNTITVIGDAQDINAICPVN